MKSKIKLSILGAFLALSAFAVTKQAVFAENTDVRPSLFRAGIMLGSRAKAPETNIKNLEAKHLCFSLDYDFPALSGTTVALNTVCAASSNITATGCGFNDRVNVSIDQAPVSTFIDIKGRVTAANTAVIVACASGLTDGGTVNQADSGFVLCCDGYQ